jgi:PAS domain S-box-containing protein
LWRKQLKRDIIVRKVQKKTNGKSDMEQVELALRVSELSYRRLFEAAQDGILILDVETGRVTDANPFLTRLLGFSRDEMVGKTVGELSPFKDVVSNKAMLEKLQKDGYVRYEDLPLETRDGRRVAVEFVSNVYQAGDKKVIQCNIRDMTARRQVEMTSNLLASIVKSSNDAIIGKNLDGIVISWNAGAEKIFGWSAVEIVGATILRLIPEDRQPEEAKIMARVKRGEKVQHFETQRITKSGRLITVSITESFIEDATGKINGFSQVARDISDQKLAALELLESKRFLQSTLDALSAHIAILDENGIIVEANAAWHRFAGANQMIGGHGVGRNYLEICEKASRTRCEEATLVADGIRSVMEGRSGEFHLEYPCHGPDEHRWFMVRVTRFSGEGPVRVVVAHENITQRKLAENEVLWKTTLMEAQLESSIDGILVVDNMGKQVLQNGRMVEMWKIPAQIVEARDEAAQMEFAVSRTKRPKQFIERVKYLYANPEEASNDEIELVDGTILERYSSPIREKSGKIHGRIWSFRDITERRKWELNFHQTQKMESIGLLAGGIAHDFNNILAAITGYLYLAKMEAGENPKVSAYLEQVSKATGRATDLVKQILAFSRQDKQERDPIKLNNVVLEGLKLLRASVPASIRIQTELTDTPTVLANATSIHQVIMNLGTNAWHAMRDKPGTLKVEMGVMDVDDDFVKTHLDLNRGRYVRLSVSDTGCGMDHATLEKIFDPFFTTKPVGEGTGLGLAVVHGIMKSHDGGVSVYSQPGEGTVFHLYFPAFEIEAVTHESEPTPVPRGNGERILFLDDEEVLSLLGKKILGRLGYTVTTMTSPVEALAAFRGHPDQFDLVVTDLTMPVMDGAKLGAQLLAIRPGIPIILTTGYSGVMTGDKVRGLGFRELLNKPSTARTLGEAVHRALHQPA